MPNQEDFDLDNLKNAWQEQTIKEEYNQSEIEAMLNKKSRNYVKYILWISLAEFLIFGIINFIAIFSDNFHTDFTSILDKLQIRNQTQLEFSIDKVYMWMKIISLLVTGLFVIVFFNSFRKINIESNLKKFILQIIKFKNMVNWFIFSNIIILVVFILSFTGMIILAVKEQNIQIDNPTFYGLISGIIFSLLISVILIMIYYKIAYGILLKRLSNNLDQLEKIEADKGI